MLEAPPLLGMARLPVPPPFPDVLGAWWPSDELIRPTTPRAGCPDRVVVLPDFPDGAGDRVGAVVWLVPWSERSGADVVLGADGRSVDPDPS